MLSPAEEKSGLGAPSDSAVLCPATWNFHGTVASARGLETSLHSRVTVSLRETMHAALRRERDRLLEVAVMRARNVLVSLEPAHNDAGRNVLVLRERAYR